MDRLPLDTPYRYARPPLPSFRRSAFNKKDLTNGLSIATSNLPDNPTASISSPSLGQSLESPTSIPFGYRSQPRSATNQSGALRTYSRRQTLHFVLPSFSHSPHSKRHHTRLRMARLLPNFLRGWSPLLRLASRSKRLRLKATNRRAPVMECPVCTEKRTLYKFPYRSITTACAHAPNICLECISAFVKAQMEMRMWDKLSCPLCPELLMYADLKTWATKEDFERYDTS